MYWPLTGAFMNVSAVTLRLLLIITAYMDDLLHEDTNIFSVNNTDYLLVPNYRIIEFCLHTEYRGKSRIFFFFSCPEFSNYRILSSHGVSRTVTDFLFFLFLSRIIEFYLFVPRLVLGPTDRREVIIETCPLSRIIEFSNFCLP